MVERSITTIPDVDITPNRYTEEAIEITTMDDIQRQAAEAARKQSTKKDNRQ